MQNDQNHPGKDKRPQEAETDSSKPAPRQRSFFDIAAQKLNEIPGDCTNHVVGALAHFDLGQKFCQPINGALAREYIKGRAILDQRQAQGKRADDLAGLSSKEVTAVRAYQKVHSDLPAEIPFIDKDALVREIERNIDIKAKMPKAPAQDMTQSVAEKAKVDRQSPFERPSGVPLQPLPKERQAKGTSGGVPEEASLIAARTAMARDTSRKEPKSAIPEELAINAFVGSGPRQTSTKVVQPQETKPSGKESTDGGKTGKKKPDSPNIEKHFARDSRQCTDQSLPKPHEPETAELKYRKAGKPADTRPTLRTIAEPYPVVGGIKSIAEPGLPKKEILRTAMNGALKSDQVSCVSEQAGVRAKSLSLSFVAVLTDKKSNAEWDQLKFQTFAGRISMPIKESIPFTENSQGGALPIGGNEHLVLSNRWSSLVRRLIMVGDARAQTSDNDTLAQRPEQPYKNMRTIGQLDSKVFQIISVQQAFPFGRQFGRVERLVPLLPVPFAVNQRAIEQSSKSFAVAEDHHPRAKQAQISASESTSMSTSRMTVELSSTGTVHSTSESHVRGVTHNTGKTRAIGEIKDTNQTTPSVAGHIPGAKVSLSGKDGNGSRRAEAAGRLVVRTYVTKGSMPDKRYITGTELAFVAVMALASASRVRPGENAAAQGLIKTHRAFVLVEEEEALVSQSWETTEPLEEKHTLTATANANAKETTQRQRTLLRPQIMVQVGDNLCDMAEALFNDCRLGHLIADLNAKAIDESYLKQTRIVRLTTRQRLSLPVYQDIIQYSATKLNDIGDMRLITIVENTSVDREVLNKGLSTMLGINSKNRDPLD